MAHAIASRDLAQKHGYLPRLNQGCAPKCRGTTITYCRERIFYSTFSTRMYQTSQMVRDPIPRYQEVGNYRLIFPDSSILEFV